MYKNKDFGIVQGRLTKSSKLQQVPKNWTKEFSLLQKTRIGFIELLDERKKNISNPLSKKNGFDEIEIITKKNKSFNYSLCSDYIIEKNLFSKNNKKTFLHIERLINLSINYKYKIFVLPLLEKSSPTKKNWHNVIEVLIRLSELIKNI